MLAKTHSGTDIRSLSVISNVFSS